VYYDLRWALEDVENLKKIVDAHTVTKLRIFLDPVHWRAGCAQLRVSPRTLRRVRRGQNVLTSTARAIRIGLALECPQS